MALTLEPLAVVPVSVSPDVLALAAWFVILELSIISIKIAQPLIPTPLAHILDPLALIHPLTASKVRHHAFPMAFPLLIHLAPVQRFLVHFYLEICHVSDCFIVKLLRLHLVFPYFFTVCVNMLLYFIYILGWIVSRYKFRVFSIIILEIGAAFAFPKTFEKRITFKFFICKMFSCVHGRSSSWVNGSNLLQSRGGVSWIHCSCFIKIERWLVQSRV